MTWSSLRVSLDGTHHINVRGEPAYTARFDEVLKFHAPGFAPARQGKGAWHIRPDGSAAYERRFIRTFGFYGGLAAVVSEAGWHHIRPVGQDAYAERYAWCGNFQDGLSAIRANDGRYWHITSEGRPAYEARWSYAGDYRDGIAVVQAADGRSTHIDQAGVVLHGRWFFDLDVFHKGYARARDEDGWMHITQDGRSAYGGRFAGVEPFYNGQSRVERFDGALEVIDEAGRTVVELRGPLRSEFAALSGDLVGFWKTQTVAAAVLLGVIEALPGTADEVAKRCGITGDGVKRLLRALGELRLVIREDGVWNTTPRGDFLRAGHPLTLADAAREYAGPLSNLWNDLAEALRAESRWAAPDIFGDVARDGGRRHGHHRMLQSYARHDYPEVAAALDLHGDERIVDAGGGLGVLAGLIVETFPGVHMTVLDREEVVNEGTRQVGHVQWRAGDLLSPWGISADAVVLARVLHDWDDGDAVRILRNARGSLPAGGRLFVVEMVMPENGMSGGLCDLHLWMATGGRERTAPEFEALFGESGFQYEGVRTTGTLPAIVVGVAI